MEGNLKEYFEKFQEKYNESIKSGKDLYVIDNSSNRWVIALPNTERAIKENGSVELTIEDATHIYNLFLETSKERIKKELNVFKYNKPKHSDTFNLSNLESILIDGRSRVYDEDVYMH